MNSPPRAGAEEFQRELDRVAHKSVSSLLSVFLALYLSLAAFMVARCAPEDRYFDMLDILFKRQRTWVGRLMREVQRQLDQLSHTARCEAEALLAQARRPIEQMQNPKTKHKLYSLHEPNVDCISKGKARKRYEFGTKVGIACTQQEGFVVGMRSYPT